MKTPTIQAMERSNRIIAYREFLKDLSISQLVERLAPTSEELIDMIIFEDEAGEDDPVFDELWKEGDY